MAEKPLKELGVRSGDLLVHQVEKTGVIERMVVPSDNSCLFTSINFCLSGIIAKDKADLMREIVASVVQSDSCKYDKVVCGKEPAEYGTWICKPESWGGAIEAQILAEHFGVELDVFDTISGSLTRFGEGLRSSQRAILIYDGIHYDPLFERISGRVKTLFPIDDETVLKRAKTFVESEKNAGKYTNVEAFKLKCEDCGKHLTGQKDAREHASSTGHTSFGEV